MLMLMLLMTDQCVANNIYIYIFHMLWVYMSTNGNMHACIDFDMCIIMLYIYIYIRISSQLDLICGPALLYIRDLMQLNN